MGPKNKSEHDQGEYKKNIEICECFSNSNLSGGINVIIHYSNMALEDILKLPRFKDWSYKIYQKYQITSMLFSYKAAGIVLFVRTIMLSNDINLFYFVLPYPQAINLLLLQVF